MVQKTANKNAKSWQYSGCRGVANAWPWRHAWRWRESELFLVVEDDAELSPLWYRATVNLWTKVQYSTVQHSTVQYSTVQYSTAQYSTIPQYGDHPHMSGLSLEHQTFTITKEDNIRNISSEVR